MNRLFERTIGIDYSGSDTPLKRLTGLRVFKSDGNDLPREVRSRAHPKGRWNWNRREIAKWLVQQIREGKPTLVGIDHAFSFPVRYFNAYHLPQPNWDHFLNDFQHYWPTDGDKAYMSCEQCKTKCKRLRAKCIRCNRGRKRQGESTWRRLTDQRTGTAKSVFQFGVNGSVAHSTHAGLPWLRYIRRELGDRVHFWPFDGWDIPKGRSAIAEVYPALWNRQFECEDRNEHQHDAYSVARWLSDMDRDGCLNDYFNLDLNEEERVLADVEGWILGVRD